jgi:predicted GIY-YIG superfamily endonuclease
VSTVYLIHAERPLHHAQHYCGFVDGGADAVARRLAQHRAGNGGRLPRAFANAGIAFDVVRTWPGGTRRDERLLKRLKHAHRYCPVCHERPHDPKHLKASAAKEAAEPIPV